MDNEIVELHPPLVTFASVEYDGDPPGPGSHSNQIPPPPAPYDHKHNLVVVNKNDLESILVSKGAAAATNTAAGLTAFPPSIAAANNKKQYISNTVSGLDTRVVEKTHLDIPTTSKTKPKNTDTKHSVYSSYY